MSDAHGIIAHEARGMASEAVMAIRSHEKLDDLRFTGMKEQMEEVKQEIKSTSEAIQRQLENLGQDMRNGFRRTDNRFWMLAITIITFLFTIIGIMFREFLVIGFSHG